MTGRMNLDSELRQFHEHHLKADAFLVVLWHLLQHWCSKILLPKVGSDHFVMLPSEDFCDLDDYIAYLPTMTARPMLGYAPESMCEVPHERDTSWGI